MAITTFTAAQVLTAAQMNAVQSNDFNQTVSTKTASHTLIAADKGTRIVMNSASATTITVNTSLFSASDTLVLQNIGAGVCTVTAGTATVSSAGALAIPQFGSGTLFFTSAGVSIFYPSAVTASSGAVVQVKSTTLTSTFSVVASLGVFSAVTGLTVAITPTSASNKILLFGNIQATVTSTSSQGFAAIFTGGNSASAVGDAGGDRTRTVSAMNSGYSLLSNGSSLNFLDSPATTSAITYGISVVYLGNSVATNTVFVNRSFGDTDFSYEARTSSTITAIEVTP